MDDAQTKMKALVVARLLLGNIPDWESFGREREMAGKIVNRRAARSISSQIGRNYRDLSAETQKFIERNFARCDYQDLARLCDEIKADVGLHLRLDEFEKIFFPLATSIKRRFPFHAHVSISTYGLQFEFPEHHFINDLDAAFESLQETNELIADLQATGAATKSNRSDFARLIRREKFTSRSMISASFSLVESFLSGLLFTALHSNTLGRLPCDEGMLKYATNRESAALKDRIDRVVQFASSGAADGHSDPFKSFIEVGKRYRDAIHHTTPFERRNLGAGQRLIQLYEVKSDVALLCSFLSLETVLTISDWLYGNELNDIMERCARINDQIRQYSTRVGFAKISEHGSIEFSVLTLDEQYGVY